MSGWRTCFNQFCLREGVECLQCLYSSTPFTNGYNDITVFDLSEKKLKIRVLGDFNGQGRLLQLPVLLHNEDKQW